MKEFSHISNTGLLLTLLHDNGNYICGARTLADLFFCYCLTGLLSIAVLDDRWRGSATGRALDFVISRSWVQILLEATLCNNLGQVVHTYVPLSPSSITWYWPKVGDALQLGRKFNCDNKQQQEAQLSAERTCNTLCQLQSCQLLHDLQKKSQIRKPATGA